MQCFCCDQDVPAGRKAKSRRWVDYDPSRGLDKESAAYQAYVEQMTYRWAFLCEDCYRRLDNQCGSAVIAGHKFSLAGQSRWDRARTIYAAQYQAFRRREAAKLG